MINCTHLVQSQVHGATKLMNNYEARSWLVVNSLHESHVHVDKAHVTKVIDHDKASSWFVLIMKLIVERAICTRSSWTTHFSRALGPYGRRKSSWSSWAIVMELTLYTNHVYGDEVHEQRQRLSWLWTHCIKAMRTTTEPIQIVNSDEASLWLWFVVSHLYRAMCTGTELIITS